MGILNLLKEFSPATKSMHLSDFTGRTLAIDAMCWLHRSAWSCAMELVRCVQEEKEGASTASSHSTSSTPHPHRYLLWLRKMLRMLKHFSIHPIVVFDGCPLPAKTSTNQSR